MSKVIGEGAYGCVHKPSLHCRHPSMNKFNYEPYVSKLMTTEDAKTELAEFVVIGNLDKKNEYHLGAPILCKPTLTNDDKTAIKPCNHVSLKAVEANPEDYSLLLLKYGGPDLSIFNDTLNTDSWIKRHGKNNREKIDNFWLGIHDLFRGLLFFKKHGIVHNDLKPQNILFNPTTSKFKFIDFGNMSTKEKLKIESSTSQNSIAIFHWSFPFDCAYMNKSQYTYFKYMSDKQQDNVNQKLIDLILLDGPETITLPPIRNPQSFDILFSYLQESGRVPEDMTACGYIDSFYAGLKQLVKTNSYDDNLDFFIDSIDVFGLGVTLQFISNSFKRNLIIDVNDWMLMHALFHKMWDFNPETRVVDLELLINEYEILLQQMGVLARLKKQFVNHKVTTQKEPKMRLLKGKEHVLSAKLKNFANNDVFEIKPKCPENKEFNPLTKRCIKVKTVKMPHAKVQKVKTVKIPHAKVQKVKTAKVCLETQEMNPLSNRCVVKCKDGFLRNDKFKCIKVKTAKLK
jgi:serine/threonine protein kinase